MFDKYKKKSGTLEISFQIMTLAHANLMQTTEASYPFKKSEVRAYNGNKGNTEVITENPYESKIPTRFLLGMIDTDSCVGNDFVNGMFILPFDVTPTSAVNMEYLSRKEDGHCRIELQFKKPLPHNIIIITYAIFPYELRIDGVQNCRVVPV